MTNKLYFDNILVGDIKYNNGDFPSFNGEFKLLLIPADNLSKHILNYIDYSSRQDRYYASMEGAVEYEPTENEQDELDAEENNFVDLIETEKWNIIESNGTITKILIPQFSFDNTIVWRLNVD